MTEIRFEGPGFQPAPLAPPVKPEDAAVAVGDARTSARAATTIVLMANAIYLVVAQLPELAGFDALRPYLDQVAPLVATPWATDGYLVSQHQPRGAALAQMAMLIGAVTLYVATTRGGSYRAILLPAAGATALGGGVAALTGLLGGDPAAVATGVVLSGVVAVLAVRAARALRSGVLPASGATVGTGYLAAFGWILILPLAVGRALFAPGLAPAARTVAGGEQDLPLAAMVMPDVVWLYAAGLSAGVAMWAVVQMLPPWKGRRLLKTSVIGALALGLGLGSVGQQASESGSELASQIRNKHPVLSSYCQVWWTESAPERSIHLSGGGCSHVSTFSGHTQTGAADSLVSFAVSGVSGPEGQPYSNSTITGLYGEILVAVAATPGTSGANTVQGLRLSDAQLAWQFQCGGALPFTVRLAGTNNESAEAGRISAPGDVPSVLVGCPEGLVRLDPATGTGF